MTSSLTRQISLANVERLHTREMLRREWLVTNGLGGYASGTISGKATRRYHGLLVAALPAPLGRVVMLNHLEEHLCLPDGRKIHFGGDEPAEDSNGERQHHAFEFGLRDGMPWWRYDVQGYQFTKTLILANGQNTVYIGYHLESGQDALRIELRPSVHFRRHEDDVAGALEDAYSISIQGRRYEVATGAPFVPLRLTAQAPEMSFVHDGGKIWEHFYKTEADRGYQSTGTLWSPGAFHLTATPGASAILIASTEEWSRVLALNPDEVLSTELERRQRLIAMADPRVREGAAAELVLAADQFIIRPAGRVEDMTRARAAGDEVRTIIAGYHWFTDWGRDTMISLEGLTLTTGRHAEAGWILRTFGHYIRDGLIPNLFPEGESEGLYHTADATLWFFHALDRYVQVTDDQLTLRHLLPKLVEVAQHHLRGTNFGIGVDTEDGLLRQGKEGYQLTWMDAKVDGWVVTPRRGKAVEINALWYNALRLLEGWLRGEHQEEEARRYEAEANRVHRSFNQRFWSDELGYLYDVVDGEGGNDPACRPNQILTISLRHEVLEASHWEAVFNKVEKELLTPVGLRSLDAHHRDFKARYFGDLRARDAAYHQGTVWGWLIGPFIDAWLKLRPNDVAGARECLSGLVAHMNEAGVGTLSEIFDAEEPFTARGCIAQAWSVAEALRCWAKTA
ncbi:amylo-alpha-1,6-glucosidase [Roseimicrobium sp. ORNL1]|uniref:amylo-alpha-1,6-glucosidase n=1 Tax=Roseimicrobium sp. ORNL1 TaxID=2711231 RepID=UPI0013E1B370|nr:amylo-alpha-1,6-glucosidase [Roseimicrobium sp. ORNL1]QIF00420.1 glycogen debranching protein [Roseimicrobium sp. ORNL1]